MHVGICPAAAAGQPRRTAGGTWTVPRRGGSGRDRRGGALESRPGGKAASRLLAGGGLPVERRRALSGRRRRQERPRGCLGRDGSRQRGRGAALRSANAGPAGGLSAEAGPRQPAAQRAGQARRSAARLPRGVRGGAVASCLAGGNCCRLDGRACGRGRLLQGCPVPGRARRERSAAPDARPAAGGRQRERRCAAPQAAHSRALERRLRPLDAGGDGAERALLYPRHDAARAPLRARGESGGPAARVWGVPREDAAHDRLALPRRPGARLRHILGHP
mmetsp:Transcript_4379/g.12671  ORF Transcript_4379/g.12671 Transcript_4379/m.12671 type:complete len:277 (-) Transcript_4379:397-1227(-)